MTSPARFVFRVRHLVGVAPRRMLEIAAPLIEAQVSARFDEGRSPAGEEWAARKEEPRDGHPLLDATGKMRGSMAVSPVGEALVIANGDAEAQYHDEGTKSVPRRPLVPRTEMPDEWHRILRSAWELAVREAP